MEKEGETSETPNVAELDDKFNDQVNGVFTGNENLWAVAFVIGLTTMVTNGCILVTYILSKNLKTRNNFFIAQLAAADLLLGLSLLCHLVFGIVDLLKPDGIPCGIGTAMILFCSLTSATALLALTIDRFRSIICHLHYQNRIDGCKAHILNATVIWILPFIVGFVIPLVTFNKGETNLMFDSCIFLYKMDRNLVICGIIPYVYVCLVSICCLYIPILVAASRHIKAISRHIVPYPPEGQQASPNPELIHFRGKIKLLKTSAFLLVACYGGWIIWTVITSVQMYSEKLYKHPNIGIFSAGRIAALLVFVNAGLNPITYSFRVKEFRTEFRRIFCKSNSVDSEPHV